MRLLVTATPTPPIAQQRHRPQIDLAPTRDLACRAHLAGAQPRDAEGAWKGVTPVGTRAPAKRDARSRPSPAAMRRRCRLGVAEIADHGTFGAEPDKRLEHAGRIAPSRRNPDCPGCRRAPPACVALLCDLAWLRARRRSGDSMGTANCGSSSAISRASASAAQSAAALAPGMGDHRRPAPVEVGGRKARQVRKVDELALGHHRAGDHALRTARPACTGR